MYFNQQLPVLFIIIITSNSTTGNFFLFFQWFVTNENFHYKIYIFSYLVFWRGGGGMLGKLFKTHEGCVVF